VNPKISIIVPIYNAEKHINKCVDSILNQTYKNFELLLINDGSPDNSGKICDDYALKDERLIVKHKQNNGVSSARNLGLKIATGEYILFVDSDDWIENRALEILANHMVTNNSDTVIFGVIKSLVSNKRVIRSEFNGYYKNHEINISGLLSDFAYYLNSVGMQPSWMYLFKASIISKHKLVFNEEMVLYEDFNFNLRYLKHCNKISFIPDALYHYQIPTSVNQLAKRNKKNIVFDINMVCKSLLDLLQNDDVKEDVVNQIYAYMMPMYTLCLKNIVIHKNSTNIRNKIKILKQLHEDDIFRLIMTEHGYHLRFYKVFYELITKRLYILAYYLLLYKFNKS